MPTITQTESPAATFQALVAKRKKGDASVAPGELRELTSRAINYLESRIEMVNQIEGRVPVAKIENLGKRIEKLAEKETKTDAEYLELAVSERKLSDLNARQAKDRSRSSAAQRILAEELIHWAASLATLLAEVNAKFLFDELATLLKPYLDGRPAIEAIQGVPAYHRAVYGNRWLGPTQADEGREHLVSKPLRYDHQLPPAALRLVADVEAREARAVRARLEKARNVQVNANTQATGQEQKAAAKSDDQNLKEIEEKIKETGDKELFDQMKTILNGATDKHQKTLGLASALAAATEQGFRQVDAGQKDLQRQINNVNNYARRAIASVSNSQGASN
jgi:hypothetical protein